MQAKKIGYLVSSLLLFSGLILNVSASTTSISFHGDGVTIDLIFPEEAYPNTTITHNVTITSSTAATLRNFTVVIKAPVNSGWQEIFNSQDTFSKSLPMSYNLTLSLPQEVNGILQCIIYVNTSSIDDLSATFYTTRVSALTFSEMQSLYYEMLANYTTLQANYETLLNEYNGLLVNYTSLFANYTATLGEHNQLITDYNNKVATYESLLAQYTELSDDYDTLNANYGSKITEFGALQSDYDDLNSTRDSLQASYNTLHAVYDALNKTYTDLQSEFTTMQERSNVSESALNTDRSVMVIFVVVIACLIAFIIYIKRKETEPYVIIRK
jgi:predicted nuclease with TOPRIM domain